MSEIVIDGRAYFQYCNKTGVVEIHQNKSYSFIDCHCEIRNMTDELLHVRFVNSLLTAKVLDIRERRYTRETGKPVTCLRNQTKVKKGEPIFLISNPEYPQYQCLDDKDGREPEPVFECNGMCGTLDLNSN